MDPTVHLEDMTPAQRVLAVVRSATREGAAMTVTGILERPGIKGYMDGADVTACLKGLVEVGELERQDIPGRRSAYRAIKPERGRGSISRTPPPTRRLPPPVEPPSGLEGAALETAIADLISVAGKRSDQIVKRLRVHPEQVEQALCAMRQRGEIEGYGRGYWKLATAKPRDGVYLGSSARTQRKPSADAINRAIHYLTDYVEVYDNAILSGTDQDEPQDIAARDEMRSIIEQLRSLPANYDAVLADLRIRLDQAKEAMAMVPKIEAAIVHLRQAKPNGDPT